MAKTKKSGLGRGLDALLGDTPLPMSSTTEIPRRADEATESHLSNESKVVSHSEEVSSSDAAVKKDNSADRPHQGDGEASGVSSRPQPYIEEDDHVTIKGVSAREPNKPNEIPLTQIKPNPDQPRSQFNQAEIEELAASIDKNGILQPILVRQVAGGYQIIAGERRYQACCFLNKTTVPVRIHEADDTKALELALVENIQRSDLNPIEEAYGYRRLMERQSLTQSELAQTVSKGRSTVANALRLLELPEDAQQLLYEEKITAGHARAILSIPTKEGRQKLTEKLVKEKLSVREAENLARLFSGREKSAGTKREPLPVAFKNAARGLRNVLGTNVRVKSVQGKNKIEIEFKDEKELERLFDILTSKEAEL